MFPRKPNAATIRRRNGPNQASRSSRFVKLKLSESLRTSRPPNWKSDRSFAPVAGVVAPNAGAVAPGRSGSADLLHESHEVVEQPFLGDFPGLIPRGDGAELDVEALVGRWDDFAFGRLHGSLHRPVEVCDGAGVIALREQDLVRPVDQMVVREDLEKLLCLGFVIVSSPRGIRLSWPVHRGVLGMPLPEDRPVLLVPRIVQRLHELDELFRLHLVPGSPRPPLRTKSLRRLGQPGRRLASRQASRPTRLDYNSEDA